MRTEKKYLYEQLPDKIKDRVFMEASFMTATEGDDLIEAEQRAMEYIKQYNYPKTISDWITNAY